MRKPKSFLSITAERCPTVAYGFDAYSRWIISTHLTHQQPANDLLPPPEIITQPHLAAMAGFRGPRMNEVLCCCLISVAALALGGM